HSHPSSLSSPSRSSSPHSDGGNASYYQNTRVDQLTDQQLQVGDQAQRKALLTQIHQQVNQDVPIIWLYAFPSLSEAGTRVKNYQPSGVGPDETWNIADWWLDCATR